MANGLTRKESNLRFLLQQALELANEIDDDGPECVLHTYGLVRKALIVSGFETEESIRRFDGCSRWSDDANDGFRGRAI